MQDWANTALLSATGSTDYLENKLLWSKSIQLSFSYRFETEKLWRCMAKATAPLKKMAPNDSNPKVDKSDKWNAMVPSKALRKRLAQCGIEEIFRDKNIMLAIMTIIFIFGPSRIFHLLQVPPKKCSSWHQLINGHHRDISQSTWLFAPTTRCHVALRRKGRIWNSPMREISRWWRRLSSVARPWTHELTIRCNKLYFLFQQVFREMQKKYRNQPEHIRVDSRHCFLWDLEVNLGFNRSVKFAGRDDGFLPAASHVYQPGTW